MRTPKKRKLCCIVNPEGRYCKVCKIRNRTSYKNFHGVTEIVLTMEDVLIRMWAMRDSYRGWRSATTSRKVRESIAQLTQDFKLNEVKFIWPKEGRK